MPEAALEAASSIRSEPLAIDGLSAQLVLRSDAALADRSQLTEGAWSARVDEAALHAGAAAALDLQVGDVITLPGRGDDPVTVRVTRLWEPLDGRDPAWAGDPIADRGADGITAGPLVVDESLWRDLATRPIAEWVAVLEPSRVSAAVLDEVTATLPLLAGVIDDDERSQGTGIVMNGGLAATVSEVQRAAAGVSAVVPVAVALIAIAGLTTLLELQRLLVAVRRDETVLLRSRGASPRRITTHAALEAAVIAVPAAALGAAGGVFAVLAASPERQTALASDPAPIVALAARCAATRSMTRVGWRAPLGRSHSCSSASRRAWPSASTGCTAARLCPRLTAGPPSILSPCSPRCSFLSPERCSPSFSSSPSPGCLRAPPTEASALLRCSWRGHLRARPPSSQRPFSCSASVWPE